MEYTSPSNMYNMPEAIADEDVTLQCRSSTKASNVSDFDDLFIDSSARCDVTGSIIKDWTPWNLVIGMRTGQKHCGRNNDDMSFNDDEEDPIV